MPLRRIASLAVLTGAFAVSVPAGSLTRAPSHADVNPDNDFVVAPPEPVRECTERLVAAGVEFAPAELPVRVQKGEYSCGAPEAVTYTRGPEHIRWNVHPLVTCGMALALADFEHVVEEESVRAFGKRVVRIEQGGTYNCRRMARFDLVSEHSYANAIDIRSVTLETGRRIEVAREFGALASEPKTDSGRFLRTLARRLYDDGVFSVVLTRFFDELHRDHFHLDLARYRVDGTRAANP